jgi:hypothetical protein
VNAPRRSVVKFPEKPKVPEGFDLDKAIAKNIGKRPPTAEEKYTLG